MIRSLIYSVILSCLAFVATKAFCQVSATRSNIVFVQDTIFSSHYDYSNTIITNIFSSVTGSSSLTNSNLLGIRYRGGRGRNSQVYRPFFNTTFPKQKTPIAIEVDGNSYALSYLNTDTEYIVFQSVSPPESDRVSATDLTKAINMELVDNEQVTLPSAGFYSTFNNSNNAIQYLPSGMGTSIGGKNVQGPSWLAQNVSGKTISDIIINGRAFPVGNNIGTSFSATSVITNSDFQASVSKLSWGINIKYSDGTYAINTRSHLFTAPLQPTGLRKGAGSPYNHWFLSSRPIEALYKGTNLLFRRTNEPTIQSFSVSPTSIDLDTRPTGNLTFSGVVLGTAGQTTNAHIVRVSDGVNIGPNFSAVNGANLVISLPNIAQPTQNESYRLIASNNGGPSHSDASVAVTQNASLTGCAFTARTGGEGAPQGVTLSLNCTIKGYPRPVLRVAGWTPNPVTERHFVPVSGQVNTYTLTNLTHFYGTNTSRTVRVTATNSSNTSTADVVYTP